ncbi:MAG: hypothetical protein ABJL35_17020 [Parasphingorhabdus sp.]|uniref:hypothetical protein n=1 Tax=Parasphingorhabdus sp. TaxID=2709688 RepID=UPI00329A11F1
MEVMKRASMSVGRSFHGSMFCGDAGSYRESNQDFPWNIPCKPLPRKDKTSSMEAIEDYTEASMETSEYIYGRFHGNFSRFHGSFRNFCGSSYPLQ